jgi:hypothetical protein
MHLTFSYMRKEDHQRVHELRFLIEKENDHTKCRELIKELVEILERSNQELQEEGPG